MAKPAARTSKGKPVPGKGKPGPDKRSAKPARSAGNSWLEQHQAVAVDSLSRLLREPASSLLTWGVIGIALALPLCLMLLLVNLQQLNTPLDDAGDMSLYMDRGINEDALDIAAGRVRAMSGVADVRVITAAQALREFQDASGFGDALAGLDDNPLPAVLVVSPASREAGDLQRLAASLEAVDNVDAVQVDLAWVQRLNGIIRLARRFTTGAGLLLCLGVVLAVGNTVRLAIENRRDEILVVKLVGGTDAYVARPFLYTGIWYGVGGGLVALVLVLVAFVLLAGPVGSLVDLYGSDFSLTGLSVSGVLGVLMAAGGLGLAGAWLSVLRHLRRIEPV